MQEPTIAVPARGGQRARAVNYQPVLAVRLAQDVMVGDCGPALPSADRLLQITGMLTEETRNGWHFITNTTSLRAAICIIGTPAYGCYRVLPMLHHASAQFVRGYARAIGIEHEPNRRFSMVGPMMLDLFRFNDQGPRMITARRALQALTWKRLADIVNQTPANASVLLTHMLSANKDVEGEVDSSRAYIYADATSMFDILMKSLELEVPSDWANKNDLSDLQDLVASVYAPRTKKPTTGKDTQPDRKPNYRNNSKKPRTNRRNAD